MEQVTIVGPVSAYPARKNVNIGDEIILKKKHSSEYGKTVEVYNASGEQIGFVAAQTSTAEEGSYLADEIYDDKDYKVTFMAKVIDKRSNGRSNVFVAEIETNNIEEETEVSKTTKVVTEVAEDKPFRMVLCEIVGARKAYPDRYAPFKKMKSSKKNDGDTPAPIPAKIEIDTDADRIIVYSDNSDDGSGDWSQCGHINPSKVEDNKMGYKTHGETMAIIQQYMTDGKYPEMDAQIINFDASNGNTLTLVLELKIYGQTAIEVATSSMAGLFDKDKFDELKSWLETLSLSEKAVLAFLEYVKTSGKQDPSRIPKQTVFNNYDEVVEDIIYSIISNSNTMLEGPMAAGKNTCLESAAYYCQKALYEIQVNSYIDNDVILGTRTIKAKQDVDEREKINAEGMKLIHALCGLSNKAALKEAIENEENPTGQVAAVETVGLMSGIDFTVLINAMKNGETEISFQPSVLITAMETGAWLVVDEFNTGQPSVMAVLNSVMDARRRIQVPGYGLVKAAPGFRLFATMNPDYEGTFSLNPATSSRFNHVLFRAADKITPIILSRVPSSQKSFLTNAEKLYKHIRGGIDSGKIQEDSINVRGFIEAAKMVTMGRDIKKALFTCVANGVSDRDDRKAIKDFIDLQIS